MATRTDRLIYQLNEQNFNKPFAIRNARFLPDWRLPFSCIVPVCDAMRCDAMQCHQLATTASNNATSQWGTRTLFEVLFGRQDKSERWWWWWWKGVMSALLRFKHAFNGSSMLEWVCDGSVDAKEGGCRPSNEREIVLSHCRKPRTKKNMKKESLMALTEPFY